MKHAKDTAGAPVDFRALFEGAPDSYLILDPRQVIVAVSDAYVQATRTHREDMLGRWIFDVFPDNPDDPKAEGVRNLKASLQRVLQTGEPDAMPVQQYDIRKPDSEGGGFEERYWSPRNTPIRNKSGQLAYIIHRVEDVTEFMRLKQHGVEQSRLNETLRAEAVKAESEVFARAREVAAASARLKDANEELARLYQKTRELDEIKTRFFANVSHELRTPLALILGPIGRLLASTPSDTEMHRNLEVVNRNACQLYRHVVDLLDVAKLEAGRMGMHYGRVDLARLVRRMASNFETVADDRHIRYAVRTPEVLHAELDIEKSERILLNLIANAFKFVPDGGAISVELCEADGLALLTVEDNGPGIAPALRETVFERFRQGDDSILRRHGGTGLGLAIVKEFVDLHGGTITLDETPGGGARFGIRLPLRAPAGTTVKDETSSLDPVVAAQTVDELRDVRGDIPAANDVPHAQALVLVVEDNPDMNAYIASVVGRCYAVCTAANGEQGLQLALERHPALILSDVMMPGMSGDQMVAAIRAHPEMADTPIVMLTAKADDVLRVQLLGDGVQDYITKPFAEDELLARLGSLIKDRARMGRRARVLEKRLQATLAQTPIGIAHLSLDGQCLYANQKLCDTLGYTAEELRQHRLQDFSEVDLNGLMSQVQGELANRSMETCFRQKDGDQAWACLTLSCVRNEPDEPDYFVAVIEDIGWRKRAQEELTQAQEVASEARMVLLRNVSHELRTPLHQIVGFAHLLRIEPLSAKQSLWLSRLETANRQLTDLVCGMIDLAEQAAAKPH